MNPTKLLDEITSAVGKYGPTLIVHLLLLVWISLRVLDPASLPKADAVWIPATERIDGSLKAVGLSLERWYVLIALSVAYLVTFQWIRNLITMFPLFRVPFPTWPSPKLLRYAAETLRMRPELSIVQNALRTRIERASRELQEPSHPYSYLLRYDHVNTWHPYYGTLLIAFVGVASWLAEGASYALSADRVRELGFLLAICCLGLRWKVMSELGKRETALAYLALDKFEREQDGQRADPLRWRRGELVEKQAEFERAVKKHPPELLRRNYSHPYKNSLLEPL